MIRVQADREGLQRLRQWTIWTAFIAACLWVAADGMLRVSEARPEETKLKVTLPAEQLVKWAIREAERELNGKAGMRTLPRGDQGN